MRVRVTLARNATVHLTVALQREQRARSSHYRTAAAALR